MSSLLRVQVLGASLPSQKQQMVPATPPGKAGDRHAACRGQSVSSEGRHKADTENQLAIRADCLQGTELPLPGRVHTKLTSCQGYEVPLPLRALLRCSRTSLLEPRHLSHLHRD